MTIQYFILDSTDVNYAATLSSLSVLNAANYSYTPTLVARSVPDNADLVMVAANVADADLVGDLSALGDTTANSVCRGKFVNSAQLRTFGFHMLGESERSSRKISGEDIEFIGASARGSHDGTTPYDCIGNPEGYKTNVSTKYKRNSIQVFMGFQCGVWGTGNAPSGKIPGYAASSKSVQRMDYRPSPGMMWSGYIDNRSNNNTWTAVSSYSNLWKSTFDVGSPSTGVALIPIDPTVTTSALYSDYMFKSVATSASVRSENLSCYVSGKDIYVHMPDSTNPKNHIAQISNSGWHPGNYLVASAAASTGPSDPSHIELINCQYVGASRSGGQSMSGGVSARVARVKYLGGRYLMGNSFKPLAIVSGTQWGYSTDGEILFDTSDRPDPTTDKYILEIVSAFGSDATTWAKMPNFIEISDAQEGLYGHHGGVTTQTDGFKVNGMLLRNIGSRHPVLVQKYKGDGYTDVDCHAFGNQGGSNGTYEFFYIQRAGAACVLYAIDDATNTQNQQNNKFRDFVIVSGNGRSTGAGGTGIDITGQGRFAARANGTGLVSGNSIQRGYIAHVSSAYGGAPPIDGYGIGLQASDETSVKSVIIEGGSHSLCGGLSINTDATYANPSARSAPQFKVSGCRFITPAYYFWNHRYTGWTQASAPNTGYYISDNNTYIYATGDPVATTSAFRIVNELTFSSWQAQTKGSPPGEKASVYDPNSTTENQ